MSENVMEPVETEKVTGLPVGEQEREELPLICSIEQKKEFCDPVVYSCAVCANRVNLECSKMFLPGLFEGKPKILICWPKTAKLPHGFTENLTDVILISDPEKYADRVRWERFGEYPSSFVIYNIRHKDISLELPDLKNCFESKSAVISDWIINWIKKDLEQGKTIYSGNKSYS